MTSRPFRIAIGGDELVGVIHLPAGGPSPCVVACHGMGASKDGDKYLELGRELPAAGSRWRASTSAAGAAPTPERWP